MNIQKVEMYLMINGKYFSPYQIPIVKQMLVNADDSLWSRIEVLDLKDPSTMLLASLLGGSIGIDRFMIGDIGLGVGKLMTCGGFGIWSIVDWFLIQDATKDNNFHAIQFALESNLCINNAPPSNDVHVPPMNIHNGDSTDYKNPSSSNF